MSPPIFRGPVATRKSKERQVPVWTRRWSLGPKRSRPRESPYALTAVRFLAGAFLAAAVFLGGAFLTARVAPV